MFKARRKEDKVGVAVTVDGRLFHALAAETGNARSPRVDLRVTGTTTDDVLDDLRRRLDSTCETCCS